MAPKIASDNFAAQLRKGIDEINENLITRLEAHRKSTEERICEVKDLEVKFNEIGSKLKQEFVAEINNMRSDIKHCYEFIKQIDKATTDKLIELEKSQNLIMIRLNRPDIVITGLPAASPKVKTMILSLAEIYNIPFNETDFQYTTIKNNKEVLVKFNSVFTRDKLLKKYYSTRNLMLKDLLKREENDEGADLEERVYLNDHLTPMANKLCYICRQLKRNKQISSFKFRNGNVPKAVIKTNEGAEKILDFFSLMEKYQDVST